ncbi:MAG: hypothetical protein Fur0026_08140 [Sideroxydans sp.]
MSKLIVIVILGIIGLAVGYAIFGKWGGEYVSLQTLFSFGGNPLQGAFRSLSGIEEMRNKVLLCGAAGAVVGLLLAFKRK